MTTLIIPQCQQIVISWTPLNDWTGDFYVVCMRHINGIVQDCGISTLLYYATDMQISEPELSI